MSWTLAQIKTGLSELAFFKQYNVSMIENEESLILTFHDHGDLPIVVVAGEKQILVEAALVERNEFAKPEEIDYKLLTTHKYLPLSTIGIENINGIDWYVIFGALSTNSKLEVIAEELLELVTNTFSVIDALEPLYKFNKKV